MSEKFTGSLQPSLGVQPQSYERNGQKCDARVVWVWSAADGSHTFALIEKIKCPWSLDSNGKPVDSSFSICWEGKYLLGLPADADVLSQLRDMNEGI